MLVSSKIHVIIRQVLRLLLIMKYLCLLSSSSEDIRNRETQKSFNSWLLKPNSSWINPQFYRGQNSKLCIPKDIYIKVCTGNTTKTRVHFLPEKKVSSSKLSYLIGKDPSTRQYRDKLQHKQITVYGKIPCSQKPFYSSAACLISLSPFHVLLTL